MLIPHAICCLFRGVAPERRAAIDTALSFDVDWMRGQSVGIFPVQNSNPEPVIAELEKILDSKEGGFSQDIVKFQLIARRNAILAVTSKPGMLRTVETWIRRLDTADPTRVAVHVYRVKYGEARQLARVLSDIFGGGSSGSLRDGSRSGCAGRGPSRRHRPTLIGCPACRPPPARNHQRRADPVEQFTFRRRGRWFRRRSSWSWRSGDRSGDGRLGGKRFRRPQYDSVGRRPGGFGRASKSPPTFPRIRLLVYASAENYRLVEQTVRQLDQPQAQVGIDATIAEVTLNNTLSYGVQFFLQNNNLSVNNIPTSPPGALPAVTSSTSTATGVASTSHQRFSIVHFRASIF